MTSIITVSAGVVPLLYSGLQLHIREHILPELDGLYRKAGREERPEWFAQPLFELDAARELAWASRCACRLHALETDVAYRVLRSRPSERGERSR